MAVLWGESMASLTVSLSAVAFCFLSVGAGACGCRTAARTEPDTTTGAGEKPWDRTGGGVFADWRRTEGWSG